MKPGLCLLLANACTRPGTVMTRLGISVHVLRHAEEWSSATDEAVKPTICFANDMRTKTGDSQ